MKILDRLSTRMKAILVTVALSALIVFCIHVEIEYAAAAIVQPVQIVDGSQHRDITQVATVAGGKVLTSAAPILDDIKAGNLTGYTYVKIVGSALTLDSAFQEVSDLETVGFGNWETSAAVVTIGSSDALDTTGGTGGRTMTLNGLDSTFTVIAEVVSLQGLDTTLSTLDSFFRINTIELNTAGSGLTNAGLITTKIGGTAAIGMVAGSSVSSSGRYTVPADKTFYPVSMYVSAIDAKAVSLFVYTRDTQTTNAPFVRQGVYHDDDGGHSPTTLFAPVTEKYDILFAGKSEADGALVSVIVEGYLKDD